MSDLLSHGGFERQTQFFSWFSAAAVDLSSPPVPSLPLGSQKTHSSSAASTPNARNCDAPNPLTPIIKITAKQTPLLIRTPTRKPAHNSVVHAQTPRAIATSVAINQRLGAVIQFGVEQVGDGQVCLAFGLEIGFDGTSLYDAYLFSDEESPFV